MATHLAEFNAGARLVGMDMTFTGPANRNVPEWKGATFETFAANEPRYAGRTRAVGTPPVLETIATLPSTGTETVAGYGANGEPLVIVFATTANNSRGLFIYQDGPTPTLLRTVETFGDGVNKPVGQRKGDLLKIDPDRVYYPRGIAMAGGLIFCQCNTFEYSGSGDRSVDANWLCYGVALAYSADNGATWELAWDGGLEPNAEFSGGGTYTDQFGQPWSIYAGPCADCPDSVWVGVASYASSVATARNGSSSWFASKFRREDGVWTAYGAVRFEATVQDGNNHCHMAYVRQRAFYAHVGDGLVNNQTIRCKYLPPEPADPDSYLDGLTARSGAIDVVDWDAGTPGNWTYEIVIGAPGSSPGDARGAGQEISMAPGEDLDLAIIGSDEGTTVPLLEIDTAHEDDTDPPHVSAAWGEHFAGWLSSHRCFTAQTTDPLGASPAIVANCTPGGRIASGRVDTAVTVYKPGGESHWCPILSPQNEATAGANKRVMISPYGYVWYCVGATNALVRAKLPSKIRAQKPLLVGPGGRNWVKSTITSGFSPGGTNTRTIGATNSPVAFPGNSSVIFARTVDSALVGAEQISNANVPASHTDLSLRVLVFVPRYDAVDFPESRHKLQLRQQLLTWSGGYTVAYQAPSSIETNGDFVLWTINAKRAASGGSWAGGTNPGTWDATAREIALRLQTLGGTAIPTVFFYQYVDMVVDQPSPPDWFLPAGSNDTVADESLTLDGFACGSEWTFEAVIETSKVGRDCLHFDAGNYRTLMTLRQESGVEVRIEHDANTRMRITTVNGADTDSIEFTDLPMARRGDPIHVGISCDGTDYAVVLSYRACVIRTGSIEAADAIVAPTSIIAGSTGIAIYAVRVTDDAALDAEAMTTNLLTNLADTSRGGGRGRARGRGRRSNARLAK
jgi:hypothetical protein